MLSESYNIPKYFQLRIDNTLNKYIKNFIIYVTLYKVTLLTDRTNKRDFTNNWFDATAFYPFLSRYSLGFPLCSIWIFSLHLVHAVDPRLPHRPPWICNTSSNTNQPSQMPSPKSKHTHTWACKANKCDETQIYWHIITCASRHTT